MRLLTPFHPTNALGLSLKCVGRTRRFRLIIAEGQTRHTTGEFVQFISHAEGSLAELETQLRLSVELGFCLEKGIRNDFQLIEELRKMLNSLRRKLVTRH